MKHTDKIDEDALAKIKEDPNHKDPEVERLKEEARQQYFDENGRWPEDDGVMIVVNI